MRVTSRFLSAVCATMFGFAHVVRALADDAPFARSVSFNAKLDQGGRMEMWNSEEIKILAQPAVQRFGQILVPVNEYFDTLEIVEAETIKADGSRIAVPSDKILASALPNASSLAMFEADVKLRTIVFPNVEVGDTVRYRVHQTRKPRLVPGGIDQTFVVPPEGRFSSYEVALDAPKSVALHNAKSGFAESSEIVGDRQRYHWSLSNISYRPDEPGAVAAIDRAPYLIISNIPDRSAIAHAYFEHADPASQPTGAIRALADNLTQNVTDRREQARVLYEYVSKNIRYMAVYLGLGGYAPHDAGKVLEDKLGDCKDHAGLLRALLAAKGIDADFVLMNLGPTYKDFDAPALSLYNHAILYLPEFGVYADPTSPYASFGDLPLNEADKPVLKISKAGGEKARTPALSAETNGGTIDADVTLRPDGTPYGTSTVTARGPSSAALREVAAQAVLKGSQAFIKDRLGSNGWHGTGDILANETEDRTRPAVVKTKFDLTNVFFGEEENRNAVPAGPRLVEPVLAKFLVHLRDKLVGDFICYSGTYDQSITLHYPEDRQIETSLQNKNVSSPLASYESHYLLDGHTLHISRHFVSRVTSQKCTGDDAKNMENVIKTANRDLALRLDFSPR